MSRYLFIFRSGLIALFLAVSLLGSAVIAQGSTSARVEPAAQSVKVNERFSLNVKVENVSNLTAFELHLAFNPAVLEVVEMTNGGFIAADFVAQNVYDNAAGTINYAVAQLNRAPANGSGTLLAITFLAKANGATALALRATPAVPSGMLLSNQNGMAIQAGWANGSITVGAGGPIITPNAPTRTPTPGSTAEPTAVSSPTPTSDPNAPTPTAGSALGTHVVRAGEHLYCIGRAYAVSPYAIAKENHIFWPNLIFPNQKLVIPNVPWLTVPAGPICQHQFSASNPAPSPTATVTAPTVAPASTLAATPTAPSCRAFYTVQSGDTLYRIAARYSTTYEKIAQVNQIFNAAHIYIGQQLCIPQ